MKFLLRESFQSSQIFGVFSTSFSKVPQEMTRPIILVSRLHFQNFEKNSFFLIAGWKMNIGGY